jgi:hypothetical protein
MIKPLYCPPRSYLLYPSIVGMQNCQKIYFNSYSVFCVNYSVLLFSVNIIKCIETFSKTVIGVGDIKKYGRFLLPKVTSSVTTGQSVTLLLLDLQLYTFI